MDIPLPAEASTAHAIADGTAHPPLWNPRVATVWGLLLSPAFSAYIHMRNWQALGQEDKAMEARTWFRMVIGIIVVACLLSTVGDMLGRDLDLPSSTGLGLLLAWHIWGGRGQERYIAAVTGGAYARLPWTQKVFGALGVFAAIVVSSAIISVIIAS